MAEHQKPSPSDRQLRLATIWALIPAIALAIPASVCSRDPTLGLLLIPMACSAVLAIFSIAGKKLPRPNSFRFTFPLVDAALAAAFLGGLIPFWIVAGRYHYYRTGTSLMSAYASVPMMMNLAIHLCFALRGLGSIMSGMFRSPTCPHCQRHLRASDFSLPTDARSVHSSHSSGKGSYAEVTMHDAEEYSEGTQQPDMAQVERSRESCDDETARMV